jgi:hydroxyacylglutathione hydrolase
MPSAHMVGGGGNTIFPSGPGNTAIPGAHERLILSLIHSKIFILPHDTIIYPGHGLETPVGQKKATPFYLIPGGEGRS